MPTAVMEKYKEEVKEDLKEKIITTGLKIDLETLFKQNLSQDTLISSILINFLKGVQFDTKLIIKTAELLDRINDLLSNDIVQKTATIGWFGEQREHTFFVGLSAFLETENNPKLKLIAQKALARFRDRLDVNNLRMPDFTEKELQGIFQPNRRPWRAMIRVVRIEDNNLWVVLPGWDSEQEIQINKNAFPKKIHKLIKPEARFFAKVNTGADTQSELYFTDFEDKT
jgi:hypothetical protein